ncbi:MAG: hypothetical protein M3409_06365 [Gemmatimonadota bacterium]|nr:hypothetical protein [Gemmatimonadota bacterium]
MCILCNADSLRLLVAPLDSLSHVDLAESVRVAREASMQLALDAADALGDAGAPAPQPERLDPEEYLRYAVDRAEQDGISDAGEVRAWEKAFEAGTLLTDPRVQAFLSSAAEALAGYLVQIEEQRAILERFLEIRPEQIVFAGIGPHGEVSFDFGDERCVVLSEEEAMQIAIDAVTSELWREAPERLLRYSSLPDDALDLLVTAQRNPQDKAVDILSGIVDVAALAEDAVRQNGYGGFIAEGMTDDFTEQRFGEVVIIRLRLSDAPHEGS